MLRRDQYDGQYLINVTLNGRARSKGLYLSADCRVLLDNSLVEERPQDVPGADVALRALVMP